MGVSIIDRLADESLICDIAEADTAKDVVSSLWALKRDRNDRGMCAVCAGPLRGRRIVYCSDRCVHLWQTDIRRIEQREHDGRWRQVSLACCETDEQRAARPPKRKQQSRLWLHREGVWATVRVRGRLLTVRVSVQAIAVHMTRRKREWIDNGNIQAAVSLLLGERIQETYRRRLVRSGVSERAAARRANSASYQQWNRLLLRRRLPADIYEAVALAIVSTGEWWRDKDGWHGGWLLRRLPSASEAVAI